MSVIPGLDQAGAYKVIEWLFCLFWWRGSQVAELRVGLALSHVNLGCVMQVMLKAHQDGYSLVGIWQQEDAEEYHQMLVTQGLIAATLPDE